MPPATVVVNLPPLSRIAVGLAAAVNILPNDLAYVIDAPCLGATSQGIVEGDVLSWHGLLDVIIIKGD